MTKDRKATIATVILIVLILAVLGLGAWYVITYQGKMEGDYQAKVKTLEDRLSSATRTVYVAAADLKAGTMITEDKVTSMDVLTDAVGFIDSDDFGKTLLVDVCAGTQMMKALISGETVDKELREVEYNYIDVTSNVNLNDFVDVRIMFPDGTDYIVLAKKQVKGLNETKLVCDLWVNEEDILMLDSACVDAYLYKDIDDYHRDARIYVTKYILPTVQEPSVPDYSPSKQTAELILNNPNIVAAASQFLSAELRELRIKELEETIVPQDSSLVWYDRAGRYLGKATNAELEATKLLNEKKEPATEMPEEYGATLWED